MAAGRQREFDTYEALDAAMRVFWKKGFGGASLSELTDAMKISKPSMYAAFGNKEQLFVKTTEHYIEQVNKPHGLHLAAPEKPVIDRLYGFMMSAVRSQCDNRFPKGCYLSLCVIEAAGEDMPPVAMSTLKRALAYNEEMLIGFFQHEKSIGNLVAHAAPSELSTYILTILHGTAAMARAGKDEHELNRVVKMALQSVTELVS